MKLKKLQIKILLKLDKGGQAETADGHFLEFY